MIIITQDKLGLVNFKNLTSITTCFNQALGQFCLNTQEITLGSYDTIARCMHVIQEIKVAHLQKNILFEMPEV